MKHPLIASLIVFLEVLTLGAMLPTLGSFSGQLGGTALDDGLIFALFAAPKIFLNPFWGRLSDKLGRKPVFVITSLGTMIGSVLWAISGQLFMLYFSRAVGGLFSAQATLTQAVVSDTVPIHKRAGAMGLLGAAFGLGMTLGPIAGGIVGTQINAQSVGWLNLGFQFIGFMIVLFVLKETRGFDLSINSNEPDQSPPPQTPSDSSQIKASARFNRIWMTVITCTLLTAGYSIFFPTFRRLTAEYGYSDATTGYALAAFGFIGILIQGAGVRVLVKRVGETACIGSGLIISAIGMSMMGIASTDIQWLMLTGLCVLAVGASLTVPAMMSLMSQRVGRELTGAGQGMNQGATAAGRTLSYALAGVFFLSISPAMPFWIGAILSLIALAPLLIDHVRYADKVKPASR